MNGHGWVTPNPDGMKARCGGPALCSACALEKVRADLAAASNADDRAVQGWCPMGCGRTLFLADGGYVTCSYLHCPNRSAVADILADKETGHLVEFGETTFTMWHPLRERLNGAMWKCPLNDHIASLGGPPVQLGRYRAIGTPPDLTWEPVL